MAEKKVDSQIEVAQRLNNTVASVIGNDAVIGFEKAFKVAEVIGELKQLLTAEYMKPIMALQGQKLGFRTDKDKDGGYPVDVVKNCLVDAVLTGLQPYGNQFNIISGNMYPTKEGLGYLLSKIPGLKYDIIPSLPRVSANNPSAAIEMSVEYSMNNGEKQIRKLDIPIRVNAGMGTDAIIGKATRKARAWLFNALNGNSFEIGEGDVTDADFKVVNSQVNETVKFEDLSLLFEMKKDHIPAADLANAQRIMDNKEEKSYSKLYKNLSSL